MSKYCPNCSSPINGGVVQSNIGIIERYQCGTCSYEFLKPYNKNLTIEGIQYKVEEEEVDGRTEEETK
jgi:transposase-like protein